MTKGFSYKLEKEYYGRRRPERARPSSHLELYLRYWLDPEAVFGGKRVLEIGAGSAVYSQLIAGRFGAKLMVAVDLVADQFRSALQENKNPRIYGVSGDCFNLPFADRSFDVVFGSLILHRFPELSRVVGEVYRVLLEQGFYLGIEPSLSNPMHIYRQFFSDHSPNEFLLSAGLIRKTFSRCGFRVTVRPLAPRFPFLCRLGLATCIGVWARKEE